jgi:RNA polymerase sigma-70 factor (ECF subfamily)
VLALPPTQRRVVRLRVIDDLPGEHVAAALGLTPAHVAVVLHRAKACLRGCMAAAGHGAPTEDS